MTVEEARQKRVIGAVVIVNALSLCYAASVLNGFGSVKGAAGLALGSVFATAVAALARYIRGWWVLLPLGVLATPLAFVVCVVILAAQMSGEM